MRKLFVFLSLFFICSRFYGQIKIDSSAIAFKAKLFTVSEYGIASEQTILKDIEKQELKFLETKYKNFIFMEIPFSQPYRINDTTKTTLIRNCSYYLAFNLVSLRFCRLGGFDNLDIDDFFNDCFLYRESLFYIDDVDIKGVDIICLHDYYKMNNEDRLKIGFKCMNNCDEKTKTILYEK